MYGVLRRIEIYEVRIFLLQLRGCSALNSKFYFLFTTEVTRVCTECSANRFSIIVGINLGAFDPVASKSNKIFNSVW